MEALCGFGVATEIVQYKAEHPGEILRRFGQQPAALGLGQVGVFRTDARARAERPRRAGRVRALGPASETSANSR